jgi:hypothetical protein
MQDEVAKHTTKIYKEIKNPGHGWMEKVKEVIIEILIIVFAVSLSIWFHNWSDHRREQREAAEFLRGIRVDLTQDIQQLDANKMLALGVDSNFTRLNVMNETGEIDTVDTHVVGNLLQFDMTATHPNIGRYEGFKSSGKIGTIEDDSLKQALLVYYQQTMPGIADVEGVVNSFQLKIVDAETDRPDGMSSKTLEKSLKMRALSLFLTQNLTGELKAYADAQAQAKKIIMLIDQKR